MDKIRRFLGNGQKGFTLLELMVVLGIMAILASIVIPSVSGSGERSKEIGAISDANAVFTAMVKFNNDSPRSAWPEESLGLNATAHQFLYKGLLPDGSVGIAINTLDADNAPRIDLTDNWSDNYTQVDWDKSFQNTSGATLHFVNDFVTHPKSAQLKQNDYPVFIFLLKKMIGENGRSIELYQFNEEEALWKKIYP